jgi:type II secretory pathway component PulF
MAMNFSYTARRIDGTSSSGLLQAESLQEARQLLKQQGLFVLAVNAAGRAVAAEAIGAVNRTAGLFSKNRVTRNEIMMLTSQLAIMSQSGVELADAIENLAATSTSPRLKETLYAVHNSLEEGIQLSAALKAFPNVFDEVFVSAIRAGEASGEMTKVLQRLATMLRNQERMQSAIRGALAYPAVLLIIAVLVLFAVVFLVLPQFSQVFKDVGIVPPATTAILLGIGELIRNHVLMCLGTAAACITGLIMFARTRAFRRLADHIWLNTFFTRSAARSLTTGRVFRLLGMMLDSRIPLLESLQLSARSVSSVQFRNLIDALEKEVTLGHMIGPVLARCTFLPPGAAQMVITAERSGKLSEVFDLIGVHFEEDGERQLRDRVKLLEPAVIVVMGVLVGFIVASVMLPLFEFSSISRHQ